MLDFLWLFLILYLIYLGVTLSFKLRFENLKIFKMFKNINKESLFISLGAKMGVGSIIGTTISIFVGGAGSIFWICLFSIITSSIVYFESFLGSTYKKKLKESYLSGPYFYTRYGLNKKTIAFILLILLISTYSLFFLMIQTNTVIEIMRANKTTFSIITLIFLSLTLSFSIKELLNSLTKLVPIMCIIFITVSLFIIIKNNYLILPILNNIISEAFTVKGILIGSIIGIKRSIFLGELLIGTTSVSSGINNDSAHNIASTQTLGIYFINFVICLLTAFIVLIFLFKNPTSFSSYNELLINVFINELPIFGNFIASTLVLFLSTTTILSGFYLGISNITYFTNNKYLIFILKLFMLLFCMSGLFISTKVIWYLIDIMMLILIITNAYVITKLRGVYYDR